MEKFTNEELKNLAALINTAQIRGNESFTVALLLQKIQRLLETPPKEEKKEEKK